MVYKRPGVYVTETLTPLANTIDAGTSSTAVFVGMNAAGGPVKPTLVTSWQQFSQIYGGFGSSGDLLPYSVYEYFNNGGGAAYISRAFLPNAVAANTTLKDTTGAGVLKVTANAPGKWGNSVSVTVLSSVTIDRFDLLVTFNGRTERWAEVSLDPSSTRYLPNILNSPYAGSTIVTVTYAGTGTWTSANTPVPATASLTTGTDGTATANAINDALIAATQRLESIVGIFDINLPGVNSGTVINPLITWAESVGNVFLVVDGLLGSSTDTAKANADLQVGLVSNGAALTDSSVAAVYGPWLIADDPQTTVPGAQRLLPPGGFVLGQYARTDTLRGVQKPAAGLDTSLRGVLGPQFQYSQTDLDNLNVAGVNVIKVIPGAGSCIFGARTLSVGMPDRYLSVRRALISLKYGLVNLTRFAIFEENDADLRLTLTELCTQYLRTVWSQGVLAGTSEAAAFFVQCDDENNTPSDIASGVVNVQIGVSLQTPAEFIIFNIGQTVTGASVDES